MCCKNSTPFMTKSMKSRIIRRQRGLTRRVRRKKKRILCIYGYSYRVWMLQGSTLTNKLFICNVPAYELTYLRKSDDGVVQHYDVPKPNLTLDSSYLVGLIPTWTLSYHGPDASQKFFNKYLLHRILFY